jgi:hypothetical protein
MESGVLGVTYVRGKRGVLSPEAVEYSGFVDVSPNTPDVPLE